MKHWAAVVILSMVASAAVRTEAAPPAPAEADVIHGYQTIFPVPLAMAATWDPALAERAQTVAAREARAAGLAGGPGGKKTVTFHLGPDELRYWSTSAKGSVQDAEAFDVWVGADSTATLSAGFTVVR